MYASGDVTMVEWKVMRQGITDRVALADSQPVNLPTLDDLRAEWPDLDVEAKLLVISSVIESITISPGKHTGAKFNTDRVRIDWRVSTCLVATINCTGFSWPRFVSPAGLRLGLAVSGRHAASPAGSFRKARQASAPTRRFVRSSASR